MEYFCRFLWIFFFLLFSCLMSFTVCFVFSGVFIYKWQIIISTNQMDVPANALNKLFMTRNNSATRAFSVCFIFCLNKSFIDVNDLHLLMQWISSPRGTVIRLTMALRWFQFVPASNKYKLIYNDDNNHFL